MWPFSTLFHLFWKAYCCITKIIESKGDIYSDRSSLWKRYTTCVSGAELPKLLTKYGTVLNTTSRKSVLVTAHLLKNRTFDTVLKTRVIYLSFQAFANLLETGRLDKSNTDVQPYVVDGKTILAELNHSMQRHYYYAPSYGDDVPTWQPRGKNPRGSDVTTYTDSGRQLMIGQ